MECAQFQAEARQRSGESRARLKSEIRKEGAAVQGQLLWSKIQQTRLRCDTRTGTHTRTHLLQQVPSLYVRVKRDVSNPCRCLVFDSFVFGHWYNVHANGDLQEA